jgi:glyoxylate/hydroxypyruvate reductase A
VLDVFAPVEPLPATSRLWAHPKVTLTPHNSAQSFPRDVARVFAANLGRFRAGAPLAHGVDWKRGY